MHRNNNDVPRGIRNLFGEQRWEELVSTGFRRDHRQGSYLLRQNDRGGYLFALTAGRVKVLGGEEDGSQVLLSLRGPGDLVGEMATQPDSHRSATVQALEHCTSRYLPRSEFNRFLHEHNAYGLFSDYLVSKLSETVPYQLQQVHFSPRERVARLLLETFALADPTSVHRRKIPFSQEALAAALGMARSTVADQIAALRAVGALGKGPRINVADEKALAQHARTISI